MYGGIQAAVAAAGCTPLREIQAVLPTDSHFAAFRHIQRMFGAVCIQQPDRLRFPKRFLCSADTDSFHRLIVPLPDSTVKEQSLAYAAEKHRQAEEQKNAILSIQIIQDPKTYAARPDQGGEPYGFY